MPSFGIDVQNLFGSNPSSTKLTDYITFLTNTASLEQPVLPEVKSYHDTVYFNYYRLGLSLQFVPRDGYKPYPGLKQSDMNDDKLVLDSFHLYNKDTSAPKEPSTCSVESTFSSYPIFPLFLKLNPNAKDKNGIVLARPSTLEVYANTCGKAFVQTLLEPDKKGGGTGPSSGSIGIWCEWSKDGIMVEFGGDEAQGPQAWIRGKDAIWKVITIFAPSSQ